jgi:hypothetical protein
MKILQVFEEEIDVKNIAQETTPDACLPMLRCPSHGYLFAAFQRCKQSNFDVDAAGCAEGGPGNGIGVIPKRGGN